MNDTVKLISKIVLFAILAESSLLPICADEVTDTKWKQPVLVELFTSEGCSSCPPADRLLFELEAKGKSGQDVIVLGEHVDYWDYLGWKDKYSSSEFTARQYEYAKALGNSVYTPEAVVDGVTGMVGSNRDLLTEAIRRSSLHPKAALKLSIEKLSSDSLKRKIHILITGAPSLANKRVQVFVAVAENNLRSDIRAGENNGAVLLHTGVVRYLHKLSSEITLVPNKDLSLTTEITLDPSWKEKDLRLVTFLQDPSSKQIWGVAQAK
jgi:hypothetical protein